MDLNNTIVFLLISKHDKMILSGGIQVSDNNYSHKQLQEEVKSAVMWGTSLRSMQCTMTITKPSRESKTAKRIWNSTERRSVMARTADIHVRASKGKTTQELHRDALPDRRGTTVKDGMSHRRQDYNIFHNIFDVCHLLLWWDLLNLLHLLLSKINRSEK